MKLFRLDAWPLLLLSFLQVSALAATPIVRDFDNVHEIYVDTRNGNVEISRSETQTVHLTVVPPNSTDAFNPHIEQNGDTLQLEEQQSDQAGWFSRPATWKLTIPDHVRLRVTTGSGDIEIKDLTTELTTRLGSGDIRIEGLAGDIDVSEGSGDARLEKVNARARVRAGSGRIEIDGGRGDFSISAGSGRVSLNDITGTLQIEQGSGNLRAKAASITGASDLVAGSGDIRLELAAPLAGDLSLTSGSGDAIVDFNRNTLTGRFILRAGVHGGKISAPFPFDEEYIDHSQGDPVQVKKANIGKGDYVIRLTTGSGLVQVDR